MKTLKRAIHSQERGSALASVLMINEKKSGKGEVTMNSKKWLESKRKGSSLVLVMCTIVILLIVGAGLSSLGMHDRLRAVRSSSDIAARCAADAGLTKAVFEMNQMLKDKTWDSSNLPQVMDAMLSNCDATFSYTITGNPTSGYVVESIGNHGWSHKKVTATVRAKGLFDYGILAQDTITLKSGTIVDGYDSSTPGEDDVSANIATTSTDEGSIDLSSGTTVDGEVLVGVEGAYLPTITPPSLPDMGAITVETGTLTIGTEDSGTYTSIDMKQGTTLEVGGGGEVILYVTGDIDMGQDSELIIQPGTSLVIYLDGNFYARNSTGINNTTEDSTNFVLYGTGEEQIIDLKAQSEWYGAVYAPNADLTIRSGADVYGSFITSSFQTTGGGTYIYYDAALQDVSETDVAAYFEVDRWQEE